MVGMPSSSVKAGQEGPTEYGVRIRALGLPMGVDREICGMRDGGLGKRRGAADIPIEVVR
jgi:hypothetical protein